MSWLFETGGQNTGASASASVLPINIQGLFPLGLTGLISLLSKRLSRVISSTTIRKHQFFNIWPSLFPALTSLHDSWKNHTLTTRTFVGKIMYFLLNILSRFVIAFLTRNKLQPPSIVILEPKKKISSRKSCRSS